MIEFGGQALVVRAAERLRAQVARVAVNTNRPSSHYVRNRLCTIPDTMPGHPGPLAGLLSALRYAASLGGATHVATVAVDTPFFPDDLVVRLAAALDDGGTIALAASAGRIHPVFGLWPCALADDLEDWLGKSSQRSVRAWAERHRVAIVEFAVCGDIDPFFNINTKGDLVKAESLPFAAQR